MGLRMLRGLSRGMDETIGEEILCACSGKYADGFKRMLRKFDCGRGEKARG
jgi:hypothetical protein